MTHRSLIMLPATVLALAAFAGPAFAGTDSDDEDGGPAATPAPVPFVQPPAPPPVENAVPGPAPENAVPGPAPERSHARKHRSSKKRHHRRARPQASPRRAVHTTQHVQTARTVHSTAVPRGGVQAGAGGTAAGLPLGVPPVGTVLRFRAA